MKDLQRKVEERLGQYVETVLNKVPTQEKDIVADEIITLVREHDTDGGAVEADRAFTRAIERQRCVDAVVNANYYYTNPAITWHYENMRAKIIKAIKGLDDE